MSTTTTPAEDTHAERWRQWQSANAEDSRNAAARARIVFTVIFIAAAGWVGLSLSGQLGI